MMDVIYSSAKKVIVWMGEDSRGEATLLRDMLPRFMILDQLVDEIIQEAIKASDLSSVQDLDINKGSLIRESLGEYLETVGLPPIGDKKWQVLLSFYRRRWFSRVWIVQEVALAKEVEVWLGNESLMWQDIQICCTILNQGVENLILAGIEERKNTSVIFHSRNAGTIASIRKWYATGNLPELDSDLYRLFTSSHQYNAQQAGACIFALATMFAASDPHDKVFGLLGILKRITKSETAFVDVDYKRDEALVFANATRAILQQTNWLGFLCIVSADTAKRCPGLPSWVVDPGQETSYTLAIEGDSSFNAPGQWISSAEHSAPDLTFSGNILGVSGARIATVDGKSEPLTEVYRHNVDFEEGAKLFLSQPSTYRYTNEPLIDVLWRTLIVNRIRMIPAEKWRQSFKNWWFGNLLFRAVVGRNAGTPVPKYLETVPNAQLLAEQDGTGILVTHQDVSNAVEDMKQGKPVHKAIESGQQLFATTAGEWVLGHCTFRSTEGYFGLGPKSLEIGDQVWIMPRSPVPFILRRSLNSSTPNRYSVIGECYVHGIMYGEFFKGNEPPQWEAVELE